MHKACIASATDDFWVEVAKCDNLPNAREREDCVRDAREERRESVLECREQLRARMEICDGLGEDSYDPRIDPDNFVSKIDNPYFPLKPGTTFIYETVTDEGTERVEFSVTRDIEVILGVNCVVVRDTAKLEGVVTEDTLDWFAQDREGNVWYFGEISQQFEDGELVSLEGSWKAGVDGAKPGIVMEAEPRVGDLYRQEFAVGVAEDTGEVLSLNESGVKVPFGTFDHCLLTNDFTPMEPDVNENKYFARDLGLVLTIDLETGAREELISVTME